MMLQDIAECILHLILIEWMDMPDVIHLDSACCNRSLRDWWSTAFRKCSKYVLHQSVLEQMDTILCKRFLKWIVAREMIISHVILPLNYFIGLQEALFNHLGSAVKSLHIHETKETLVKMVRLVHQYSPRLQAIKLTGVPLTESVADELVKFTQLQRIDLRVWPYLWSCTITTAMLSSRIHCAASKWTSLLTLLSSQLSSHFSSSSTITDFQFVPSMLPAVMIYQSEWIQHLQSNFNRK